MKQRTTFIIATNGYDAFALDLLMGLRADAVRAAGHHVVLLTDAVQRLAVTPELEEYEDVLDLVEIPSYAWPDATILRFELMAANWDHVRTPFVGYIDADMLVRDLDAFLTGPPGLREDELAFVAHPGYYRAHPVKRLAMAVPPTCVFENRRPSRAFVPIRNRLRMYVCGGQWLGGAMPVRRMVEQLALNVRDDRADGLVARHHDESHINRYRHGAKHVVLDPRWAYSPIHGSFRTDRPIAEVVEKPPAWFGLRSDSES